MNQTLQFLSQIIPWIISLGSLYLTYCVLRSNERQKKFEIYFEKKSKAYNYFLEQMALVYLNRSAPVTGLSAAYYQALVYSNDDARHAMNNMILLFNAQRKDITETSMNNAVDALLCAIRSDLDDCQKELSSTKRFIKH